MFDFVKRFSDGFEFKEREIYEKQIKNLLLFYWQKAGGSEYCLIQILSGSVKFSL